MLLLHRPDIDEYKTIHKEDEQLYYDIIDKGMFDIDKDGTITRYENRLELIKDRSEIRRILDEKFSSRNRTEEYTPGLPSASVINSLFPLDIDYRKPPNQSNFYLLRWWNNTPFEDMKAQKITNRLSTDTGSLIHKIIELAMVDDSRIFVKKRSLNRYIELAFKDEEIIKIIKNIDDRKDYFSEIAFKTLTAFFDNELEKIHPIYNELFFNTGTMQGSIDMVNYRDKKLCLTDMKTSKKSMSREQAKDKGYMRQLLIYADALYEIGVINKAERDNLLYFIYFWNWNSGKGFVYEYTKDELEKERAYVAFINNWYWSIKNS